MGAPLALLLLAGQCYAGEETYVLDEMWLRQEQVADLALLKVYRAQINAVAIRADARFLKDATESAQLHTVAEELSAGLSRMLGMNITAECCDNAKLSDGTLSVSVSAAAREHLGAEGFRISSTKSAASLTAATASGALFGAFRLLSHIQRGISLPQDL